jgi:hypothetical protein
MLATKIALHDVRDVDGFVNDAIRTAGKRASLILRVDEREELEAEGLRLIYELAVSWGGGGSFSGYASRYLPDRLISAMHKMRGDVRRERLGARWWESRQVQSLDQLLAAA